MATSVDEILPSAEDILMRAAEAEAEKAAEYKRKAEAAGKLRKRL